MEEEKTPQSAYTDKQRQEALGHARVLVFNKAFSYAFDAIMNAKTIDKDAYETIIRRVIDCSREYDSFVDYVSDVALVCGLTVDELMSQPVVYEDQEHNSHIE